MQGLWAFPSPCVIDLLGGWLLDTASVCLFISLYYTDLHHKNTCRLSPIPKVRSGMPALVFF